MPHSELSLEQLPADVHAALRSWQTTGAKQNNLLDYLLLVQRKRQEVAATDSPPALRRATNEVLLEGIEAIGEEDENSSRVLNARFIQGKTLAGAAYTLNVSNDGVSRLQKAAIRQLAKLLYEQEMTLRQEKAQRAEDRLPSRTYTDLYGQDEAQAELLQLLLQPESPWVVALEGIGGIGKTSLADRATRQVIRRLVFERVAWVRLDPQSMTGRFHRPQQGYEALIHDLFQKFWPENDLPPFEQQIVQLRREMKSRPCLVVIDNLESETDTAYLLTQLHDLTSPSKILLTTRTQATWPVAVYGMPVQQLSLAAAEALLRGYARECGVRVVEEATPADIQSIYDIVGGNPLALKLVVTLLDTYSLTQVLSELERSTHQDVEKMYRHIYRQAWRLLSHQARALLKAMPLVSDFGGEPGYLRKISGLTDAEFWPALQELHTRSLLEVWGTLHEKRYGIHRLTETFVRNEIIQWPDDEVENEDEDDGNEEANGDRRL